MLDAPVGMSAATLRRFAEYITAEVGIQINDTKAPMLQSRLMRRVRALGLRSLDEYLEYLFRTASGHEERVHFVDAVTTNKTDFFREAQHFQFMERLLAERKKPASHLFRVWCAGCSTGEEAYTLAMVLEEHAATVSGFRYSIVASDVSTRVLQHAQTAIYPDDRIDPIPPVLRQKYLMRSRDSSRQVVRIVPELRRNVTFLRLNFMEPVYPMRETFEAIFFRNVMIYFDRRTQEAVLNKLCRRLDPSGHLFVGHSESLASVNLPLQQVAPSVYRGLKKHAAE